MIQRKLVFCIDNNINFVSGSIPATKLTANDINRDVIYVVAPFEISSVIKVKFADELNQQENVSQLLKYTNEVSVDELVEKTKPYYETVKDWNVYYIEMSGKPLSFVSNRISTGIYISFSVVITKPKTNLVSGLNFVGYEYGESLETLLNNGEYKIIRNPLFKEDGVSYNVDDIIYKENDNYFRVSASVRKGGTTGIKYLVEPNVSAIDESLDPTLTEQIIEMVTDLEQDVAHISRNAVLKDGSVDMEDDLDLGGNSLNNVNEIKVDTISSNGGSYIEVINDINVSGNDIGNVANIETNSAYTQRLKVDIIENYNSPFIEVSDDIDMNGKGIYGVGEVEGEFGTFNNSLTKGGKEVATIEYVDQNVTNLQTDKVDKTTKVIGLDLQDDILLTEFKTALGNATQSVAGLLSAEDKTHLDGLVALLENSDGNNVVDTIGEILAIFNNYPEGADLVTALNGKVDKVAGKGLSQNDFTDIDKNKVDLSYTHREIVDGSNPHNTKFVNIADKPTTRDGYGITDVYTKPETYTQLEINNLLDNLSAVKGLKSTLLTPTELSNGDTISTNLLTNNGAYIVFTATDTSTGEIDSDTVPVSTIITGKKFVFFDNQEIVFTIGETNSTFETSEDVTLKINLLYLNNENVQAIDVDFDGSLTNYLENQENVQSAINKLDDELKTTNDNLNDHITDINNPHSVTKAQVGLGNVDNTSDLNKPISTLTQNALNNKSNVGHTHIKSEITDLIEATQSLSGLMSATDKQRLDVLHALLEEDTENNVVDTINEVLAIFNNYPEGADLVSALAGKVDKVAGKGLSANDYTNTDKQNVEKIPTIEQDIVDLENDKVDKNNAITAGTKTKITYDAKGLVTGGADLVATDIPNLDAAKITTGTFADARIPNLNASKINAGTLGADRIPTLAPSKITQDANNRFVTDTEKSTWNGKQSALVSGINIKTVGGESILGSGDIPVSGGGYEPDGVTIVLNNSNELEVSKDLEVEWTKVVNKPTIDQLLGNLSTLGFVKRTGTNTYQIDTSTYQPLDADLTSIAGLSGTSGLLKKTASNTWTLDTSVYLTSITKAMVEAVLTGTITTHTHNASAIVEDATHRFVTDAEKNTWNAKQSALGFTPENQANKKTTLTNNDVDFPTTKAVKTAIDTAISQTLKPMGNWNASTNTPALLATDVNRANQVWYVAVAGTQFGIEFDVGDELVYNTNGVIFKRDNVDAVISVNGKKGVVVLTQDDVADGSTYKRVTETEKTTWNGKVTSNAAITAGTKTKITYDTKGLVTGGSDLVATDIPNLHASKITSGTLGIARGGTGRTDGYAVGVVETRASVLTKIWAGNQAQYDAIVTKDENTLYFITE